jgi:LysR family transcriptional regulator for metE and metH
MKEKLKPSLRGVTLKQLRALTSAARAGTISAAAQALNVTPPAVTLQMRLLEQAAGMPLLERTDKGLRPTDGGREILATANRIEAALIECGEALEALSGMDGGRVSVGVVSTAKYFAPRALAAFAKAHPKVEIRLLVGNREETIAGLAAYDLDFAVMGRPPQDFAVANAVIGDHPHIIIGPAGHPLARRKRIALAGLEGETFLLRERGSGTRLLMQRMFAAADISPNFGMEIGSNETIKQAVMAGLGIALISAHTVSAELRDGRLAAFNVSGLPIMRQWFVVRRQEKRLLPAAQSLWDFLATSGSRFLPETAIKTPKARRPRPPAAAGRARPRQAR